MPFKLSLSGSCYLSQARAVCPLIILSFPPRTIRMSARPRARAVVWGANSQGQVTTQLLAIFSCVSLVIFAQLCLPHLRDCHVPTSSALDGVSALRLSFCLQLSTT